MTARDRGALLAKLADLMEEHQEELATLESIDSGAVYTLALKTHIGMSIATWRYFAGWFSASFSVASSRGGLARSQPPWSLTMPKSYVF